MNPCSPVRRWNRGLKLALVCAALACAAFAACGRKALPRPPQWVVPEMPAPLEVTAVEGGTKLSWRRPTKYVDGATLDDLGRFDLERSCADLPWEKIAELAVSDRERFRRNRNFAWVDRAARTPETCHYRVTAITLDGYASAPAESWLGAPAPTPRPSPTPGRSDTSLSASPTEPSPTPVLPAAFASPGPLSPADADPDAPRPPIQR